MSPDILSRIRCIPYYDKLLLLLAFVWIIVATPANYLLAHGRTDQVFRALTFATLTLLVAICGIVAYSVIRQHRRPADYGLSLKRGGLVSLAILALIHIYLVISGKFVLDAGGTVILRAWGAFMEELVFRSILIDTFVLLMHGIERKVFWAILASTVLWMIPHVPSKPLSQLIGGIFLGGLAFGYVYYKSRSVLLPAWIHSVANAGYFGGMLVIALYCVIGIVDWAIGSVRRQTPGVAVSSTSS